MNAKRAYKQYSKEFKEEAVALILEQDYTVPQAAESLGVSPNLLYKWKDKFEEQQQGLSLSTDERHELKQLRKENKILKMEKDILKRPVSSSRKK